ncbi:MAG: S8 family serine peptidase [Kiritimatiellia bacterium]
MSVSHSGWFRRIFRIGLGVVLLMLAAYGMWLRFNYLERRDLPLPPPGQAFETGFPVLPAISGEGLPVDGIQGNTHGVVAASESPIGLPPVGGVDVIPGEYVLYYADGFTRARLLGAARRHGVRILAEQDGALRVRARDRAGLAALLRGVAGQVEVESNLFVRIPPLDEPGDALRAPAVAYRGFADQAPAWLGVPEPQAEWGRGVMVAVLDTGVAGVPVSQRLDLVGAGGVGQHGSLVAGVLAKMLPGASILDVQVMSQDGIGDAFTVAKGIRAAVDAGARIINLSIGTRGESRMLAEAVRYAQEKGVLLVASAGNEGVSRVSYPAAYDGVLSVAAIDADERHLYFSNRGDRVDVAAPGVGVMVMLDGVGSVSFSGTSAAAPFVTATAGLALGLHDALDGASIFDLIVQTANDTGSPGADALTGAGIVSPVRAMEWNQPGIVDMGVLRPHFEKNEVGDVQSVMVAAQNRGTVGLATVEMIVVVNDREYRLIFEGIGSGATIAHRLDTSRYVRADGALDVTVRVVVPGDIRPDDNQIRSVWLPVAP